MTEEDKCLVCGCSLIEKREELAEKLHEWYLEATRDLII